MKSVFTILLMAVVFPLFAKWNSDDSVEKVNTIPHFTVKLGVRFHSMGQFNYGGRIVSENPTVDFNLTYDRKAWGFQIFKAMDLHDRSTDINFTLAVLNKRIHLGKNLTITPSAGFILEQFSTMADRGSDVVLIIATSYKISSLFTIEHSSMFGNLVLEPNEKDWVNRLRIMYSKKHIDISVTGWHNNKVFDTAEYITYGGSIAYSRIKISKSISMNAGLSGLMMPYFTDKLNYPQREGLYGTIGFTIQ